MKVLQLLIIASLSLTCMARAEVEPVKVRAPETKAWTGQRVPFYVDLQARGTFSGTASFDLPQIPGALVIKIGEPVVGTQNVAGESWFVQKHEFALFSQKVGVVEIPVFPVRFSRREGFTGPASEVEAQTTALTLEIQRPPGSEHIGFLITTESLVVTETWDPLPGTAQIGAMFKRTIVQRADQLPGMALASVPTDAPDGIRLYPGPVTTKDSLNRGDFIGERSETVTYLLQNSGALTVPELTYEWWNPKTKTLQSKTLPAVTFEVTAPPVVAATGEAATTRFFWLGLLTASLIIGWIAWQRRRIAVWGKQCWRKLNPPDRVAARELLRACHRHDAAAAEAAWIAWRNTQGVRFLPDPELRAAILGMQRVIFHPATEDSWQGNELARVFTEKYSEAKIRAAHKPESILPSLNPHPRQR